MADFHAGKVIFDADLRGLQKVDAQLEQFRIRQQRIGRGFDKLYKEDYTRKFTENLKKGFESGFNTSIGKGENQMYAFSHAVGVAGSALSRIKSPVENAADSFQKLQKSGYMMQTGLSLLFSTIGDLAGGILGLVGVAGQALPAFAAFGGAIASVGSGFVGVKVAMSGVSEAIGTVWKSQTALNDTFRAAQQEYIDLKYAAEAAALSQEDAAIKLEKAREALARVQDLPPDNRLRRETELQFKQAELNYRETAHKSNEAYRAVKKGITATSAYQPLAALNSFQLGFVKFMVAFRPAMLQLTRMASEGFIPKLTEGIKTLMANGFPVLEKGLAAVASAMGDAFTSFTDAFKNTNTLDLLGHFFKWAVPVIHDFGEAASSAFGIILNLLRAVTPLTKRFTEWVEKGLQKFNSLLYIRNANGSLVKFFQLAGDAAAGLGKVFGNIKDALLNIVRSTFPNGIRSGAGGIWLTWLDKITKGFATFTGSEKFSGWLKNTAKNATTALSTVGQFLKIFLDLAGQKSTQEFWLTLRGAVAPLKQIFVNGGELGKTIANVLVSLTSLLAALADSATLKSFFNTVAFIADVFAKIITFMAPLLNLIGYAHGAIIAIVAVVTILKNFLAVMMGYMEKASRHVATLGTNVAKFRTGVAAFSMELKALDATQKVIANGSAKDISRAFAVQALRMGDLRGVAITSTSALKSMGEINKRYVNEITGTTAATATAMQKFGRGLAYIPASFKTIYKSAQITALMSKEALRDARAMAAYEEARQMGMGTKELAKRELQVRATSAAYKGLIDIQRLEQEARLAEAEGNDVIMKQKLQEIALIAEGTNAIHMDEAAAKELAATYVKLAQDMGMDANEIKILSYELQKYIETNKTAIMTNEQMVASSQTLAGYDLGSPQRNPGIFARMRGAFKNPTSKMGMGVGMGALMGIGEVAQSGGLTAGSAMSALGMGLMFAGPEMLPASLALTAVGGIVDSIQSGIAAQAAKIKEIRIQNATIYNASVVDRSNFNRIAIRSGAFTNRGESDKLAGLVQVISDQFATNAAALKKSGGYTGTVSTAADVRTYFGQLLSQGGKKAVPYLNSSAMTSFLGNAAGQLSQATGMNASDLGTAVGQLTAANSVTSIKNILGSQGTGLVPDELMKSIPASTWSTISKSFKNGQLTNSGLQTLINAIVAVNQSGAGMQFVSPSTTGVFSPGASSGSTSITPIANNSAAWKAAAGYLQAGALAQKGKGFTVANENAYASLVSSLSYGKATALGTKTSLGLDMIRYMDVYAGTNKILSVPQDTFHPGKYVWKNATFSNQGNALKDAGVTGEDIHRWMNLAANTAAQAASTSYVNLDATSKTALDNAAGSSANAAAEMAKLNSFFQQNFVSVQDIGAVLQRMETDATGKGQAAIKAGGATFYNEFVKTIQKYYQGDITPRSAKLGPHL